MTEPRSTRIPAPIYAAAGAGALAYQQLRKLPAAVNGLSDRGALSPSDLRERAATTGVELREKAATTTAELRERAAATLRSANTAAVSLRERAGRGELDIDRLREAAIRNAAVVVTGAQAAQERALAVYGALVARGERVVGTGVVQAAETVNADLEATEAPAAVTATPAPASAGASPAEAGAAATPADLAESTPATPAKRRPAARPAAKTRRTGAAPAGPVETPSAPLPSVTKRTRPATDK